LEFIICENFTLSEVEMPHLRHLRAFKTALFLRQFEMHPMVV